MAVFLGVYMDMCMDATRCEAIRHCQLYTIYESLVDMWAGIFTM